MNSSDSAFVAASVWTGDPEAGRVYHHGDLAESERASRHGTVSLVIPETIVAGDPVDVAFTVTLGETGLSAGARIRIAWRWPFDWADLQQADPAAPDHLDVSVAGSATLDVRYEHRGDLNPWHHDIDLRVADGSLSPGETIDVRCTRWNAPTFATEDGYFLVAVSPDGGDHWDRLVDPPRFRIVPGPPDRLVAIAPADGGVGERAVLRVRAIDAWENPTAVDAPSAVSDVAEIGAPSRCDAYPVWEIPLTWTKVGVHRIEVSSGDLACVANPTRVTESPPEQRVFWGDVHAGQSEIGCGAGSLDNHYAYARDVAGLQFASQQANDHYVTRAIWDHVREVTPRYDEPGRFLAYLGCEWSPYVEDGGDRNVMYLTDERRMRRSDRFFEEHDPDPVDDLNRAPEFLDALRHEDVFLNLHVGGRPTNLDWHAPEIEPLFEVHSTHATSEWFLFDALRRGYRVGVTAGTDGVMGRPGACGSGRRVTRNVRNGLTAVTAAALTQRDVADAFHLRRCYGTTGARILLDVSVGEQPMGGETAVSGPVRVDVACEGTAGVERIDLFRGTELVASKTLSPPDPGGRLRILFGGAREEGTAAAQRQVWDGSMTLSSGSIRDVLPVAFQCPLNRVTPAANRVDWRLATAGNDMGFTFQLDGEPDIEVTTEPRTFTCSTQDFRSGRTFDAGGVRRRIEIGPAPADETPKSVSLYLTDEHPTPGEHAYWVRVVQTDRHLAWSSPVYVDCK